ncbi:hypothetical protein [Cellulomonas sp.]|uniref:hypothetical protein n=1 Tax=Cellulomonas sp. TaxID=40001 RepID=UPI003BAD445C
MTVGSAGSGTATGGGVVRTWTEAEAEVVGIPGAVGAVAVSAGAQEVSARATRTATGPAANLIRARGAA